MPRPPHWEQMVGGGRERKNTGQAVGDTLPAGQYWPVGQVVAGRPATPEYPATAEQAEAVEEPAGEAVLSGHGDGVTAAWGQYLLAGHCPPSGRGGAD